MSEHDRRSFLKQGALLSAVAATGAVQDERDSAPSAAAEQEPRALPRVLLRAVAQVVLPSDLGPDGREQAVVAFESWLADYEPVAELSHGYGTSRIRYAPPDPAPGWRAQLEGLDLEARRRQGVGFTALPGPEREVLVRAHIEAAGDDTMDAPLAARHVAVGLMAHFFDSPGAADLAYGARIGKYGCRGIATLPLEPTPLRAETARPGGLSLGDGAPGAQRPAGPASPDPLRAALRPTRVGAANPAPASEERRAGS